MTKKAMLLPAAALLVLAGLMAGKRFGHRQYYIEIPTYNQQEAGYPRGCEGVSLYMALQGKGYALDTSLDDFMASMPLSEENPEYGYVGDPTQGKNAPVNSGRRTTINPAPLAQWGREYGDVVSLEGARTEELKKELRAGNPLVVYVTGSWAEPVWDTWDWGEAVVNNHAVCLVGYDTSTGAYLINDCGGNGGEYQVEKDVFEDIYNARKFAVAVR